MSAARVGPLLATAGAGLGLLVVAGPLAALLADLLSEPLAGGWLTGFGPRRLALLAASLVHSAAVAALALLIALPAASLLADLNGNRGRVLRLLALCPLALPSYLHGLAWQQLGEGTALANAAGLPLWVDTMARLPVVLAAALAGLATLDCDGRDAGRLHADPARAFFALSLPQLRPVLIGGAGLAFLLSLNDYGLPALFQRHSYALEVLAEYSASGDPGQALAVALPLVLISAALTTATVLALGRLPAPRRRPAESVARSAGPGWFDGLRMAALAVVAAAVAVPVLAALRLVLGAAALETTALDDAARLAESAAVATVASLGALGPGWRLAETLHRRRLRGLWLVLLLGLALPASLTGTGVIRLWSWIGLDLLYAGWPLLLLGHIARLVPLVTLLLYAFIRHDDPLPWDAARVLRGGTPAWLGIRLPWLAPALLAALFLGFALTLPELELNLLLAPPGHAGVGVRIFNYLHYGAAAQVALLSAGITGLTLGLGLAVPALLLQRRWRWDVPAAAETAA